MSEDLKKHLYGQLNTIKGLSAIVVSDRDGVPVIKVRIYIFLCNTPFFLLDCLHISYIFVF